MDKIGYSVNDNIFDEVYNTLTNYGMPCDNFLKNIRTLKITSSSSNKTGYNPNRNTIFLSDNDNLVHELFNVASYDRKNISGNIGMSFYDKNKILRGENFSNGVIDLFTSLIEPSYKSSCEFEMCCAKILTYLFGMDIFKSHFNNNASEFFLQFRFCTNRVRQIIYSIDKHKKYQETALKFSKLGKSFDYTNMKNNFHDIFLSFEKLAHILKLDLEEYKKFVNNLLHSSDYMTLLCESLEYNIEEKQL